MNPIENIDLALLRAARLLAAENSENQVNREYNRALAELIICVTPGLNFDDTQAVLDILKKKD